MTAHPSITIARSGVHFLRNSRMVGTTRASSLSASSDSFANRQYNDLPRQNLSLRFSTTSNSSPMRTRAYSSTTTRSSITRVPGQVSDRGGAVIWNHANDSQLHLPPADPPVGQMLYKKAILNEDSCTVQTSMHVGTTNENGKANGVVGDDVSLEDAKTHARNAGLRLLATLLDLQEASGAEYERVLHLRGFVKATSEFTGHAAVIDGCSEVLADALGPDAGVGTRECLGVASLGASVACTVEMKVRPKKNQ